MNSYSGYPDMLNFEGLKGPLAGNGDLGWAVAMTIFFLLALCAVPICVALFGERAQSRLIARRNRPVIEAHTTRTDEKELSRHDRAA